MFPVESTRPSVPVVCTLSLCPIITWLISGFDFYLVNNWCSVWISVLSLLCVLVCASVCVTELDNPPPPTVRVTCLH